MKKSSEKITLSINASAESAWKVIGAVGGVDKWFAPLIQSCRVDGNKRYCTTEAGPLNEDILEVNHNEKIFRYGIPKQQMIPVDNIIGTIAVLDNGNGTSTIEWSATFDVLPEKETEASEMFKGAWTMGIQGLEKYVQSLN